MTDLAGSKLVIRNIGLLLSGELGNAILALPLVRYTEKTHVDPEAVLGEYRLVRTQGFAVCADELDPGVLSLACPVHPDGAGVLYSIGVVGLSERLRRHSREVVAGALHEAADRFPRLLDSGLGEPVRGNVPEESDQRRLR